LDTKGNRDFQNGVSSVPKKSYIKIGKPGYKIVKVRDVHCMELGFFITIKYPNLKQGEEPIYRFMSAYEQQMDNGSQGWQYLVVHGEPYQNIAFKVPAKEITRTLAHWDEDLKEYYIQFFYKSEEEL
jgi:splicing factor 3A subunit 2